MTRNSDPRFNLADALSEDIVAAPADTLAHDAESDVASFDRIAARAAAQSRRRRLVERLRGLLPAIPAPVGWTSAMAAVAGIFVMVIAGGLYFHQPPPMLASAPAPVLADRTAAKSKYSEVAPDRLALAPDSAPQPNSLAQSSHAAAVQPAPAAAPPVAAPVPPPAPPAAAGVAQEEKRARALEVRPDVAPSQPPARMARRATSPAFVAPPFEDPIAALAMAAEQTGGQNTAALAFDRQPSAPAAAMRRSPAANKGDRLPTFVWPVRGRVVASFGPSAGGGLANGVDLAVPSGTDIRAAEDGVVLYAGADLKDLGNLLLLRHRDGFITAYAHAQSFAVKPGDKVRRGQVVAKSGQTGAAAAPQLHFEIRKDHVPVDPAQYLPPPG